MNLAPRDWCDTNAWDQYFKAELQNNRAFYDPEEIVLRFVSVAEQKGGRIWFPGCGVDFYPETYASKGFKVVATDFSKIAVRFQLSVAEKLKKVESADRTGSLQVIEHDFTKEGPPGEFDLVINCRAFQGLQPESMRTAAANFYAALRPGGVCIVDTMNVQGALRNVIEDSLLSAGFYVPFQKSDRWQRQQLDGTGIVYGMLLGRPRIPRAGQYPKEKFDEFAERDQKILDSLQAEYENRCRAEEAEARAKMDDRATIVAHVVYATG